MRINSATCLFVLSFLTSNARCRETESSVPTRYERNNLQEFMGDGTDPNFWPVRGRRSERDDDVLGPFSIVNLGGEFSFRRGGRKPKEEDETTGVFWAGRGRSAGEAPDPDDGNFWAHRGRSVEESLSRNRLTAEEPGWVWVVRGDRSQPPMKTVENDSSFCSTVGKSKRQILRQRLCHLKRKANTLLRELPQTEQFWPVRGKRPVKSLPTILEDEQFWPVRGKRENESWQENLRELKTFWPARGRRDEVKHEEKQQPKEVT